MFCILEFIYWPTNCENVVELKGLSYSEPSHRFTEYPGLFSTGQIASTRTMYLPGSVHRHESLLSTFTKSGNLCSLGVN